MSGPGPLAEPLDRECRVFTRYLIGDDPGAYVLGKYREAHARLSALAEPPRDRFDELLDALAAGHPALTRLVDAYARVFRRAARVRVKLVVLLAILECAPESHQHLDPPGSFGLARVGVSLLRDGVAFLLCLVLATSLLGPAQLLLARAAPTRRPG